MDYNDATMNSAISNKKRTPLKDRQLRRPGQSLESKIQSLQWNIAGHIGLSFLFIALAFLQWWQWYRNLPPNPVIFGIVAALIVVYSSVKIRQWKKQLRSYRQGLIGEREVSQILNPLIAQGCTIFDDVWTGKFNIDHVVISPRGIFAIETKTRSKPASGEPIVTFDGKAVTLIGNLPDSKPIDEAVRHAGWLRKKLGKDSTEKLFKVKPVIVYPGWYYKDTGHNKDIWVLNPGQLEAWIAQEPISLTKVDIALAIARLEPYSMTPTDESTRE